MPPNDNAPPTENKTEKTPILLLKNQTTPRDGYDEFFRTKGDYEPIFIPVLEHRLRAENLARVRDLLLQNNNNNNNNDDDNNGQGKKKKKKYGGVIFTSQRAVEGFATILNEKEESHALDLSNLVFYVVGPATKVLLQRMLSDSLNNINNNKETETGTKLPPIIGAEAGTGDVLVRIILKDYNERYPPASTETDKPALLFLAGEQRRDVIPQTLAKEKIPHEEITVYETSEKASFEPDLKRTLERLSELERRMVWIAVFSPAGCDALVRTVRAFTGRGGSGKEVRVATIGPTTRDYLRDKYGFDAHVCADKPSPEGLGEGINAYMVRGTT